MSKKIIVLMALAILLVLGMAGGGYFYFKKSQEKPEAPAPEINDQESSKAQTNEEIKGNEEIIESATRGTLPSIQTNPMENKPDLNPADKANPYEGIKTNPFE